MLIKDKIYIGLCLLFAFLIVIGNLTYQKFVALPLLPFYTFELSVGVLFYPFTYMISDLIAEFYGKERANFCVKLAVGCNVVAIVVVSFMASLPATAWSPVDDQSFRMIFGAYVYAFMASMIACYFSQRMDIVLYLGLKKITAGKMLWLRNTTSTALALFLDTAIVNSILVIFEVLPPEKVWSIISNSYCFKLLIALYCIPLFYLAVMVIKYLLRQDTPSLAMKEE